MKKHIANIITGLRILCSILMLLFCAFSVQFYVLYLFCGVSDMIDGTIARKTNCVSEFGARFDTVADIIFAAVSLIKFLPSVYVPRWLWIWMGAIAIIKLCNIVWGFISEKKLISLHTASNKITGALLFLLPLTLPLAELKHSAPIVCSIATFSAIREGYYIKTGRKII